MNGRLAVALAAVLAYGIALHALHNPEGWKRHYWALRGKLSHFWAHLMEVPGEQPAAVQVIAAHPSVKAAMTGPLAADGEPLKDWEAEALAALWWSVRNESAPQPRDGSDR